MNKKKKTATLATSLRTGAELIGLVLKRSVPRPAATEAPSVKNMYAVRFAAAAAEEIVKDLKPMMKGITASAKREAKSTRGAKQLDINFSTPATGLALGISLKSVHLREPKGAKRYTHNKKRNEEELRIEASGYHKRQPYAVMIGVLFLPFDSCADARSKAGASSFGAWVQHLRPYSGRIGPHDDPDRFEKIYIALYQPDGSDLRFFDVDSTPTKNSVPPSCGDLRTGTDEVSPPLRTLEYGEFLKEAYSCYVRRNKLEFKWADGSVDTLQLDKADEEDPEESETDSGE